MWTMLIPIEWGLGKYVPHWHTMIKIAMVLISFQLDRPTYIVV